MRVTVVCTDDRHPIYPRLREWASNQPAGIEVEIAASVSQCDGGDILFLVSCSEIVTMAVVATYTSAFVIHASDLPARRGWSPHVWAILEGESEIVVSLIGVAEPVDTGQIFFQTSFTVEPHEVLGEISSKLFDCEFAVMDWAIQNFGTYAPREQNGTASWCRRRTPADSQLDPAASIEAQFDTLRLADSRRYPAFFDLHGHRYTITIEKVS